MRRTARSVGAGLAIVAALKVILVILDDYRVVSASTPWTVILLGVIIGMTYGLLGVGLVLIFRTNRIINFAHGQIGAFAAAVFGLAAVRWGVPYWLAFPPAILLGGATGAAAEAGVIRRLRHAPRLMSIVATLGVGQFLVVFAAAVNSQAAAGSLYPQPAGLPVFDAGALRITQAYAAMLVLSPVAVVALAIFLRRSRYGLAMRSAAANPEAARMSGISASRMSSLAWALAGGLSALTAILTAPTQGFTAASSFGPALLLRALTGAVVARMDNLPLALGAGVGLGVVEQVLLWNYPRSGLVEVSLFVIILFTLVLQRPRGGRDEEKGSWASVQALKPIAEPLRQIWLVRRLGVITGFVAFVLAAALPLVLDNSRAVTLTGIMGFAMVGLSIGVLTGLGGQLTLGQFAVAGVGAVVSFAVSSRTGDFGLALVYAGLASAAVSMVLGLPALRIRGLMLTATTLSFALLTPAWLMTQPWMLGTGRDPGRPIVLGHALSSGRGYYFFALALMLVTLLAVRNVRRSGFGRLLVAIRDNEENARAFTIRAPMVKMQGYVLAGFIAGLGGAAYGHSLSSIGASTFPASASTDIVVMSVIGGISVTAGPILGALWVLGVPAFVPLDSAGLAATQLGSLLLILFVPTGLVRFAEPIRDRLISWIARRHGLGATDAGTEVAAPGPELAAEPGPALGAEPRLGRDVGAGQRASLSLALRGPPRRGVILQAEELRRSFGGVKAVDGVSFSVRAGETLGLIGPNGAGKTTTFELLSGFTRLDSGQVRYDRRDVTTLGPEGRARLGLIRSFQDAALFPTLTVLDTVMLALERISPTRFLSSVLGWTRSERAKELQARELVATMGLDHYRDRQIRELSTGTRRITEIACLVALEPALLLLDEPSSGIAQRETEALGQLLVDLKRQLNLTLVVIEHDIPLIMGISDRIVAMADGRVIAVGSPTEVRNHPQVVESYLGGNVLALERSGATLERARR